MRCGASCRCSSATTSKSEGGRKKWGKRFSSLGKAAIYGGLCWGAVSILLGSGSGGNKEQSTTRGILGWPGGRWIVGAIALAIAGAALWNFYRAVSGKYKDSLKTGQMSATELRWTTRIAFAGLMSRAVVFGLIAWFFFKAAADYNAKQARGLDGALRKLLHEPYGPVPPRHRRRGVVPLRRLLPDPGEIPRGLGQKVPLEPGGGEAVRLQLVRALREAVTFVVEHDVLDFSAK